MTESQNSAPAGERIAKRMAAAGMCSRREAERWITDGRVAVNGQILKTPAVTVGPYDRITIDGRPLPDRPMLRMWRYHKPAGLITTHRDPEGRPTVFERLPKELGRVVSVGRLDLTSEGLLLLANHGGLARKLELPATGWTRRYRVRVYGETDASKLSTLAKGVTVDGVRYGPVQARIDSTRGGNAWLAVSLKEGKNREVRKVLESLGLEVSRLIRTAYGPFQLGTLSRGSVAEVPRKTLREQLGPALVKELER